MKVVIYSRVSTNGQDFERQTKELKSFSESINYEVVKVFEEKISGAKKNRDRPVLMEMMNFIKENKIQKVLVWELSRLGRNAIQVLQAIELFNEDKISLYIHNFKLETLDENGNVNPLSHFMIQIITAVYEMERTSIKQRMKSGYDNYRLSNKVGRKNGFRKSSDQVLSENKDVVKYLKQGYSIRNIAKLSGKSSVLVQKVKKIMANPH